MNGDGPRQSQGQLFERSLYLALNLARLLVQRIARILPLQWFHLDGISIALAIDGQTFFRCLHHSPNAPIIIKVFAGGVILDKHHLRTLFQHQCLSRGIGVFRERALDLGTILVRTTWELLQLRLVVEVGKVVVGGQADVTTSLALWRGAGGEAPAVQLRQSLCRRMSLANLVQQLNERLVLLTIDVV